MGGAGGVMPSVAPFGDRRGGRMGRVVRFYGRLPLGKKRSMPALLPFEPGLCDSFDESLFVRLHLFAEGTIIADVLRNYQTTINNRYILSR